MVTRFNYLIDKLENAVFTERPFRHLEIRNFLELDHFEEISQAPEICIKQAKNDRELCDLLLANGYEPIKFPGCTNSITQYLNWREGKSQHVNVDTCEGFGLVFRLNAGKSPLISALKQFLSSEPFINAMCKKFHIARDEVFPDIGIQKYLDGYEISPHPDIRKKALTFMVNINPSSESEMLDHHTHYLEFKDKMRYVQTFWEHNPQFDRSWVPWDWCDSVKQQNANNSIIIFSPSHDTMHAVKAKYNHLQTQRTQLYGNLWYGQRITSDVRDQRIVSLPQIPWQGLLIDESRGTQQKRTGQHSKRVTERIRTTLKRLGAWIPNSLLIFG